MAVGGVAIAARRSFGPAARLEFVEKLLTQMLGLALEQLLELSKVRCHRVSDPWDGDPSHQAHRSTQLQLHRVRDPGALWDGVEDIGQPRRKRPKLTS